MYYYKICISVPQTSDAEEDSSSVHRRRKRGHIWNEDERPLDIMSEACVMQRSPYASRTLFYASGDSSEYVFGLITSEAVKHDDANSIYEECLNLIGKSNEESSLASFDEILFKEMRGLLEDSERNDVVESVNAVLDDHSINGLEDIYGRRWLSGTPWFRETLIPEGRTKEESLKACRHLKSSSASEEIARIYDTADLFDEFVGHPTHYLIDSGIKHFAENCTDALLGALYSAGRLNSRKSTMMELTRIDPKLWNSALASSRGGVLCASIERPQDNDDGLIIVIGHRRFELDRTVPLLAEAFGTMRNDTLLILSYKTSDKELNDMVCEAFSDLPFVSLSPDVMTKEEAKNYLAGLCEREGIPYEDSLMREFGEQDVRSVIELDDMFNRWMTTKRMGSLVDAYSNVAVYMKREQLEDERRAKDELDALIGLDGAKSVVEQFIAASKARKLFKEYGRSDEGMSMHMVFSGNPGTAKTTVARLLARILKEEGVLEKGHLVEVGRADLVGKFVGSTAPKVKRAFEEARGGVLFVDEAYSLVDDKRGLYGDEAINTIVQEMENLRDEVVVIFAGYPTEMDKFISRNPGLRSRVSHHVHFPDYCASELMQIAEKIAKDKGLILSSGAKAAMKAGFETVALQSDFGNGRFVRNVIEQSVAKQATRLISSDASKLGKRAVLTITKDDVVVPVSEKKKSVPIGFAA